MKVFLSLSLLVTLTLAEPPVYRQQSQNERNKYYFARQQEVETPPDTEAGAPYQASGWKPEGPAFELPQRQQQQQVAPAIPQQQYGAPQAVPQQQYGAPAKPQKQYGAPATPQQQYGAPQAAPQQQYRAPSLPQQQRQQYRAYTQRQQSVVPAAPQQQYGEPLAAQQQYGAPSARQQQYGAPSEPQQQYGAPSAPQQQYGAPSAPQQGYGVPPQQNYGPPEGVTTTQEPTSSDFDESTTLPSGTESQAEPVDSVNELDEEGEVDEQQRQSGEYYVALPDGRLQRIQYMSSQDIEAMKYFARIQAENVEPLRGPIYAYKPLQKLEFAPTNLRFTVPDPYAPTTPLEATRESARNSGRTAKAAPEKLQQGQQQQQQPLAAEVRYDRSAAIVGLTGANVAPLSSSFSTYNAGYHQAPNNEQRYLISF